ncbi:MAG: GNAT family N-acetyltransferase [Chloroflexota bacterium]|nr:GNAT family N-acetyltransferase [Chloroflexota bacterium]MDE2949332.1 GNAT family N-acetyltransferase [Chloroflexota bacterium]
MQIRPYQGRDETELLDVWRRAMSSDRISEDLFRTQVLLDPNFHPDNLPVAVIDGRVVGFILCLARQVPYFLQGLDPAEAWITAFGVHPDYRRQGVGSALFESIIGKLRGEQRKIVDISPYVPNYFVPGIDTRAYPDTIRFLQDRMGFETLYHAISMGADLTDFQIPPQIQARIARAEAEDDLVIKPIEPADIPDLMPFLVEHFGWDWFRFAQSYLLEYFGDSPHRICFLIAREKGEVVGFCQQRNERYGPFGVRPDCRNRGIGRMLLFKCLEMMSAKHVFYAYFLWTDEDAARLYSLAGFKRRREFAVMRKTL